MKARDVLLANLREVGGGSAREIADRVRGISPQLVNNVLMQLREEGLVEFEMVPTEHFIRRERKVWSLLSNGPAVPVPTTPAEPVRIVATAIASQPDLARIWA
jgi:predicted ArsR family transcriptional regulator